MLFLEEGAKNIRLGKSSKYGGDGGQSPNFFANFANQFFYAQQKYYEAFNT